MGATRAKPLATASGMGGAREFLESLARILVRSGYSPRQLPREFQAICRSLKEPKRAWSAAERAYLADLSHVIAHWYGDPRYLDAQGAPLALALSAKGPSLLGLIERALPGVDAAATAQALIRLKAVHRQKGRFLPGDRNFLVSQDSGFVHGLTVLLGILRTVERNLTGPKQSAILQRCAFNPSFPVRALPQFHAHTKKVAGEFLWGMDSDMRRVEEADPGGPRTRVGVCVFAFEEPVRASGRQSPLTPRRAIQKSRSGRRRRGT